MAKRGGALTGLVGVVGLIVLAAWVFRDRIPGLGMRPHPVEGVSREAAEVARAKLESLDAPGDTVHMTDAEFTSLVRYQLPGLAGPLLEPSVDFVDNTFFLNGRFPSDQLPDSRELDQVREFVPDTADVVLQGELRPLRPGRVALRVSAGSFARIPLNRALIVKALGGFGNRDEPGLQADEYLFTLPSGVESARVEDGELVLVAGPR